jgi:DNA-binding XRE family transcriptional regulator
MSYDQGAESGRLTIGAESATLSAMMRSRLLSQRQHLGLTRPQLAAQLGVSRNMVYSVEVGRRDPGLSLARKWLEILGPGLPMDLFRDEPEGVSRSRAAE